MRGAGQWVPFPGPVALPLLRLQHGVLTSRGHACFRVGFQTVSDAPVPFRQENTLREAPSSHGRRGSLTQGHPGREGRLEEQAISWNYSSKREERGEQVTVSAAAVAVHTLV